MVKTGVLSIEINTGYSRLETGAERIRLAMRGPGNQFGNATEFLVDVRGLSDGDLIWVTGSNGIYTGVAVFFITDSGLASEAVAVLTKPEALNTGLFRASGRKNVIAVNMANALALNKPIAQKSSGKRNRGGTKNRRNSSSKKPA